MTQKNPKFKVVFQDSHFLAAHKPAGIPTYGESKTGFKELLEEQLVQRLFPVHRIDADTEGLVLFALNSKAAAYFTRMFKEQKIKKTYYAWVEGAPPKQGSITKALTRKTGGTESARTDYKVLKQKSGMSLVEVHPKTGRFHQIRRHFQMIGHPVVGDPIYNPTCELNPTNSSNSALGSAPGSASQAPAQPLQLFAESVEFEHPISHRPTKIQLKLLKKIS